MLASSRGSWGIVGPLLSWELSWEETRYQSKGNAEMSPREKRAQGANLSEVTLERQSLKGWPGWKCPLPAVEGQSQDSI